MISIKLAARGREWREIFGPLRGLASRQAQAMTQLVELVLVGPKRQMQQHLVDVLGGLQLKFWAHRGHQNLLAGVAATLRWARASDAVASEVLLFVTGISARHGATAWRGQAGDRVR